MKIKLVTHSASERLLWQHRIMNCQPPEGIAWVAEELAPNDKLVWIISDETSLKAYQQTLLNEHWGKVSTLVIVVDAYKVAVSDKDYLESLESLKFSTDVLLLEADYEPGVLRQCLFKPMGRIDVSGKRPRLSLRNVLSGNHKGWSGKFQHIKVCVSGPAPLAYELGAMYALQPDCHVLVLDLDRFAPTADIYTGVKAILDGQYEFFNKASATGLNVLLDCAKKGNLQKEVFSKCTQTVKGFERLHILTGVYQLADYEYYRAEDIKAIIERAAGYYDVILMKTNGFIYDGFTLMAQKLADLIITGLEPDIGAIRAYRQTVQLLKEKQGIPLSAQHWVLVETQKTTAVDMAFYENLAGSSCMGRIPKLVERQNCTATGVYYLSGVERQLSTDYKHLMRAMEKVGVMA